MQQSIITGMLFLSVSRKSFSLLPSSPILSLTCCSIHVWKGVFGPSSGPILKWIPPSFFFAFGVVVGTSGAAGGSLGFGGPGGLPAPAGSAGGSPGFVSGRSGGSGIRAMALAIFARSPGSNFCRSVDLRKSLKTVLSSPRSSSVRTPAPWIVSSAPPPPFRVAPG